MAKRISGDVLAVLAAAQTDGVRLVLQGELGRALYLETNKVLQAAGGQWNSKAKAHIFPTDAAECVDQLVLQGEITNTKQDFGCFFSPPAVVERLVEAADLRSGLSCLEPSAGNGAIVRGLLGRGHPATAIEIRPELASQVAALGVDVTVGDFLDSTPEPRYDRVVMNPPFAKGAEVKHVLHAIEFLRPGGRLVSVMSASLSFRTDRRYSGFRERISELGGRIEDLPESSFKNSGTNVATVLVQVERPNGI